MGGSKFLNNRKEIIFVLIISLFSCNQNNSSIENKPQIVSIDKFLLEDFLPLESLIDVSDLTISDERIVFGTWMLYYYGEKVSNNLLFSVNNDNKLSWQNKSMIIAGKNKIVHSSFIWIDPQDKLWLFWNQGSAVRNLNNEVWYTRMVNDDLLNPNWSAPELLTKGIILDKPIILFDGKGIVPVLLSPNKKTINFFATHDAGNTWEVHSRIKTSSKISKIEKSFIVQNNEKSLNLNILSYSGLYKYFSVDNGENWNLVSDKSLGSQIKEYYIKKLNSGNLLHLENTLNNAVSIESAIYAYVSDDNGFNLQGGLIFNQKKELSIIEFRQNKFENPICDCNNLIHILFRYKQNKNTCLGKISITEYQIINRMNVKVEYLTTPSITELKTSFN